MRSSRSGAFVVLCASWASLPLVALAQSFAYVADIEGALVVIDTAVNRVVARIPVGIGPGSVGVHPDGDRVYVKTALDDAVAVVDTHSHAVVARVRVGLGPADVAVLPDGSKAYVTLYANGALAAIDTRTNAVAARVATGAGPFGVDAHPDGSRVYTVNRLDDTVSVIDTAGDVVIGTIAVSDGDGGVAVSPDGATAYVTNFNADQLTFIDTATGAVVRGVVLPRPFGVAVHPDGTRVYVTSMSTNTLHVLDARSGARLAAIAVGDGPYGVDLVAGGGRAYVVNFWEASLTVVDTQRNVVLRSVDTGQRGFSFSSFVGPPGLGGVLDGFVPATVYGGCLNLGTGQGNGFVPLATRNGWNCARAGVVAAPGDAVVMVQSGEPRPGAAVVGGEVTGVAPGSVSGLCRNERSGQTVAFHAAAQRRGWDCRALGLSYAPGERVRMIQVGTAR